MSDPRLQKLAKVLVQYSLGLYRGENFYLIAPASAAPLIREVYREAVRAGVYITTRFSVDGLNEIMLREGSEEQIAHVSEVDKLDMEQVDAYLQILGATNTKALSGIEPKRMALAQSARAPLLERLMTRTAEGKMRWCLTLFPTQAYAQDASMSLSDYEDFVFGACLLDQDDPIAAWQKVRDEQQKVADFLNQQNEIHIVAPGTDITYCVQGRTWINCFGDANFPDGEVFTGPIENSVNGTVRFTYPAIYTGNEVEDVRLMFQDGKVIEASAGRGEKFLLAMLDMDAGARYLGEVAFGLNYGIQRFSRNILFDEKIGGTMHMALGASYPESGGQNKSGLHWDLICDLHDGQVYADGKLCYQAGRFIINEM